MFGKIKEHDVETATDEIDDVVDDDDVLTVESFFGDEEAVAEATRVDALTVRVGQVEQQLSSQFTSMAAYAQIAQEQIELARAEAKSATERTQRRVIELIERERADRIADSSGSVTGEGGLASPGVIARLDVLESSIAELRSGLAECLERQRALAEAITSLLAPKPAFAPPTLAASAPDPDGPIPGLAID